ncbi:hypothetical protein [Thiohalocapsa marina]
MAMVTMHLLQKNICNQWVTSTSQLFLQGAHLSLPPFAESKGDFSTIVEK